MQAKIEQDESTSKFLKQAIGMNRHERRSIITEERKQKNLEAAAIDKIRNLELLTIGDKSNEKDESLLSSGKERS